MLSCNIHIATRYLTLFLQLLTTQTQAGAAELGGSRPMQENWMKELEAAIRLENPR